MKVKSQVMSNIVRMLENEGPFKDVIYVILENVSKYLKMPDVTVMQYDEERTCLYPVLSYGGRHHLIQAAEVQAAAAQTAPQGTVERQVKAAADSPLYGEKLCYYKGRHGTGAGAYGTCGGKYQNERDGSGKSGR